MTLFGITFGWVDIVLLAVSWVVALVSLERIVFYLRRRFDAGQASTTVGTLLDRGAQSEAIRFLAPFKAMPAVVAQAVLTSAMTKPEALEDVYRGEVELERLRYERGLSILASVGSNAPFVGLLGTVLGIMEAFKRLATIGPSDDRATVVMGAISEALRSTALGILVAIPAVVAYNAFQKRTDSAVANTESLIRTILARARNSA